MHHSFNVLVLNKLLHVSAFQNAIIKESDMNMLRWCPKYNKPFLQNTFESYNHTYIVDILQ
jgi:hypothetical protein